MVSINTSITVVLVLIDVDGVAVAAKLDVVFKSQDLQLGGGQLVEGQRAGKVGVQAVLYPQHSVHVVAGLHLGDHLGGLLHHVHDGHMVRAGAFHDSLHQRADGLCAVALHKVLHLGQDDRQVCQLLRLHNAGENIGQLEGLVFSNFDLVHSKLPLILLFFQCKPEQKGARKRLPPGTP